MDGERFDNWAKTLTRGAVQRRGVLEALCGGALVLATGRFAAGADA